MPDDEGMSFAAWLGAFRGAVVAMLATIATLLCVLALDPEPAPAILAVVLSLSLARSHLDRSTRERLEAAIRGHLAALHGHGDYTSASIKVFNFGAAPAPDSVRAVRRAYEEVWRGLIAELQQAGALPAGRAPDVLRNFLLGALNGSTDWYRPERFDIATLAREFAALISPAER